MTAAENSSTLSRTLLAVAALAAVGAIALQIAAIDGLPLIVGLLAWALLSAAAVAHAPRTGTLVSATGAFAANAYLFSRKLAMGAGDAACNISEVINCDAVNSSPYSEAFGVPITLLGMGLYAGLATASLMQASKTPRLHQLTALFALISLAYSIFLAAVSASMGHLCVICVSIYVANGLLLWSGLRGLSAQGGALGEGLGNLLTTRSFVTIAIGFALVMVVGGSAWRSRTAVMPSGSGDTLSPETLAGMYTAPLAEVPLDGSEPVLGDPEAPYLVVEFADFACPHCARAERELHKLVEEHPEVQVRFRVFPLTAQCNEELQFDGGEERCVAAYASECARQQGRFWEFADKVFRNQQYLAMEDLEFQARETGLDIEQWKDCVERPATREAVLADARAGHTAGVQGTPTMYLRGTHGEDFIMITSGPMALVKLIEAHQAGVKLPAPAPYGSRM